MAANNVNQNLELPPCEVLVLLKWPLMLMLTLMLTLSCHLGGKGSSLTHPAGQGNNRLVSVTCGVSNLFFDHS